MCQKGNHAMKKIYVLSGSSHVGKTNTLHRLAILMNGMPTNYKLDAAISAVPPPKIPFDADRQYVFEDVASGRRIGISTAGDNRAAIDDAFDFFARNNCDIGFVASKSHGCSIDEIEARSHAIHVTPVYFWLIWTLNRSRSRNQIQIDTARLLESVI